MIELRHLRYFLAVAEELHFGRAAARLHMAQPPLSQQIRQLEAELGFKLFHRTRRQVELTTAGHSFLADCQGILQQLDRAIQRGQQINRGELGQLSIGFVSSATYNVLPSILRTVRQTLPEVTLTLRELTTDQQLADLQAGRLDVGFVRPPVDLATFATLTVLREPLAVALASTHPLAASAAVSVRSLVHEPFILFPRPLAPGLYDQIIGLCQQADFSPAVAQEAVQMQTIISLVAAEIGIAIVPQSLENLQRTGVVYRPLREPTPPATIALIWPEQGRSPTLQRFLQIVQTLTPHSD